MGLFRRKPSIKSLLKHVRHVEVALQHIEDNSAYILSPCEFYRLQELCDMLSRIEVLAHEVGAQCQVRIATWQNTPYTPAQLLRKRILFFFGWWIGATLTLSYGILGWFTSLFPQPWHMLVTSAILGFIIVIALAIKERGFLAPHHD